MYFERETWQHLAILIIRNLHMHARTHARTHTLKYNIQFWHLIHYDSAFWTHVNRNVPTFQIRRRSDQHHVQESSGVPTVHRTPELYGRPGDSWGDPQHRPYVQQ